MNIFELGKFYFMRHGETDYNVNNVVTGSLDVELNENGRIQARKASKVISSLSISICLCSPLVRALDTAAMTLQGVALIKPVDNLYERNWGELEGVSKKELSNFNFSDFNVESWEDFNTRTITALSTAQSKIETLVVAHSGTYKVLLEYLKIDQTKKSIENAKPYLFIKENGKWNCYS